jgi:formiminotetrahydrofolate cyclodeaminase
VASALTAAQAASLVELSAGLAAKRIEAESERSDARDAGRMREIAGRAGGLRESLLAAAERDTAAYGAVFEAADRAARTEALALAADPPLQIAECAAETAEAAAEVSTATGTWAFGADAMVAARLAAAAAAGASVLVAANLGSASDDPRVARARDAADRAQRAVPDRPPER